MDRSRRFAVRGAIYTAVLAVVAIPVSAQKPTPAPVVKATPAPTPKPVPSPVIVINNVPAAPASKETGLPAPVQAAIITLSGQSIIAFLAWLQFQKNYEQKNREIKDRDDQVRLAEANKEKQFKFAEENRDAQFKLAQEQAKGLADQKERVDREHFRSKELQDQFGDIQDRLASTEPIIRANAAIRLAQFGKTLKPGEAKEPKTEENYPYFIDASSQLATALHLESNPAIRKAIREAIKNLVSFASTDGDDQPLIHALIERLADVNRTARDSFIRAFAEWAFADEDCEKLTMLHFQKLNGDLTHSKSDEGILEQEAAKTRLFGFLASVAPFCQEQSTTRAVLESLMYWGERHDEKGVLERESLFMVQKKKRAQKCKMKPNDIESDVLILQLLDTSAQQLIDTRDALAGALQSLKPPTDFPSTELKSFLDRLESQRGKQPIHHVSYGNGVAKFFAVQQYEQGWKRKLQLNLSNSFLCGANLHDAALQGADFFQSDLQGANLGWAQVQGANFNDACLQEASLSLIESQGANFRGAQLQRADLGDAGLQGANLSGADLHEAHLEGSILYQSNLINAKLQGANLINADIQGAYIYGTYIREQETGDLKTTILPSNTLDVAVFDPLGLSSKSSNYRTSRLKEWLTEQRNQREA